MLSFWLLASHKGDDAPIQIVIELQAIPLAKLPMVM
jgi:hypothetical protein